MWGDNRSGQIGNNVVVNMTDDFWKTSAQTIPVNVLDNVKAVSCGNDYTAAIKSDGSLWMWGDNRFGQLGNGGTGNKVDEDGDAHQTVPVKIMDDVSAVSCGTFCTAAIKTDGSLWMWGNNGSGLLGNGTEKNTSKPEKIMNDVIAVSCGRSHTAAIKSDGSLWMWGNNLSGELGNNLKGNVKDYSGPYPTVPVKVMDNVIAIECGNGFTAAIKADGTLWMWGDNDKGQLGNGGNGNIMHEIYGNICQTVPERIMDNVSSVSCGDDYTAAIKKDGSLWMWGRNDFGQLGNGTQVDTKTPGKVMDNVISISCGREHNVAVQSDGSVWTWGYGGEGQLGNGDGLSLYSPVKLSGITGMLPNAPAATPTPSGFGDVQSTAYYFDSVKWAVAQGITTGTSASTFSPEQTCTRAQILTFLWRAAGSPEPKGTASFSDIDSKAYYAKAAAWAAEQGMITGNTLDAYIPCTRLEAVEYMWRYDGSSSSPDAGFADVKSPAVDWAVNKGVTNGTGAATFSPEQTCTRAQIVTFLYRAFA